MSGLTMRRATAGRKRAWPFLLGVTSSVIVGAAMATAALNEPPATDVRLAGPPQAVRPCAEAGITPQSGRAGTCRAGDTLLTVAIGTRPLELPDRRVKVISTRLVEATTADGRARDRARLEVRLRVENLASRPIVANPGGKGLYLGVDGRTVAADPNADRLADALERVRGGPDAHPSQPDLAQGLDQPAEGRDWRPG